MALFGLVKEKVPVELLTKSSSSLRQSIQERAPAPLIPDDVDLSALWEDPNDQGSLPLILSGVAAAASTIGLIAGFFGK